MEIAENDYKVYAFQCLKGIEYVKEAYFVYGVNDVVAKIEAKSIDELNRVAAKILSLSKVGKAFILIEMREARSTEKKSSFMLRLRKHTFEG